MFVCFRWAGGDALLCDVMGAAPRPRPLECRFVGFRILVTVPWLQSHPAHHHLVSWEHAIVTVQRLQRFDVIDVRDRQCENKLIDDTGLGRRYRLRCTTTATSTSLH